MKKIPKKILLYGGDILKSERMATEKDFIQHGNISCYDHSLNVAKKKPDYCRLSFDFYKNK